ncbi:ASCC2 protein, partial [Polypterus senegalus]
MAKSNVPLDELQVTERDPRTGKEISQPALVVFDESLQKCLESYLRLAPRGFDSDMTTSPAVSDMQKHLHRSVFFTFLRMATHKESKDHFITPAVFGEIIYNNFLFDIPKILDLCVLYGKGNGPLLHKMIENIFSQQEAYYSDLDETIPTVLQDFVDVVQFLCDTCTTLCSFLDIFPTACKTFQNHKFLTRLACFYEILVPELETAIRRRTSEDKSSSENINLFVEDFLQIFTTLIQEKRFLADYDEQFPVADDISLLQQTSKPSQVSVSSGELESLIFQVQDLLPDLGEGFIMACLEEYAFDSEVVINNILESKLLPNLEKLDRTLPRPKKEVSTVLSSRCNIFDDDEFDVFNRDHVDTSCIWKGKRQRGSARALVNDKQHVKEQKERYKSYEVVVEEIPVGEGSRDGFYTDNYDDEYDDTYDANQVGANDQDDDTELLSRRPFTTPLILSTKNKQELENERDDNEDDDYKEEEKNNGPMRDLFIQDPAVLREQAEARRAAQYHRRGFKPDSSANVTGAPRGRGQSKETVQERRKKESHKSTRANHNRRAMADRKRNKGMIPS